MNQEKIKESIEEKIKEFLNRDIDPKTLALYLRKYNHAIISNEMERLSVDFEYMYLDEIKDGYYWVNQVAELLDPYLKKE